MAVVQNPMMSVEAHGGIAGVMFRTGTYGNVLSRGSISAVGRSAAQCTARARIKIAQSAWAALTDIDRSAWAAIAVHPDTAKDAFISRYCTALMLGLAPLTRPIQASGRILSYAINSPVYNKNLSRIRLEPTISHDNIIGVCYKTVSTYSGRSTPNAANYRFGAYCDIALERHDVFVKCPAKYVFLLIAGVVAGSQELAYFDTYKLTPSW